MAKRYIRVGGGNGWRDYPSTNTPRNARNFNIMDKGIDDLDNAIEDMQGQVNHLVVSGDSSVEAAQARVRNDGKQFSTLKERMDVEYTEVSTQLQQIAINIKSLGALGDGVTDDTDIIQAALNTYTNIYFPSGTYIVTTFTLINFKTILTGDWHKSIIKLKNGSSVESILNLNSKFGWKIKDLIFDGNRTNASSTYGVYQAAIEGISGERCELENVVVQRTSGYGLYIGRMAGVIATRIEARYTTGTGIYFGAIDSKLSQTHAWDCGDYGVEVAGSNNQLSDLKCSFSGKVGDYTTAGMKISAGNNMLSNVEVQDNFANGIIIDGNNTSIVNLLCDCNGNKAGDTGSSGLIVNGNNSYIVCKLRNTFTGYPNTQYYAIKGNGTGNTIHYKATDMEYGNNKFVTLSSFKNRLHGNINAEIPLSFGAVHANATITGKAYLKGNTVKVNAIVKVITTIGFYQVLFRFTDGTDALSLPLTYNIPMRKSDDTFLVMTNDPGSSNIITGTNNLTVGTYYIDTIIEL